MNFGIIGNRWSKRCIEQRDTEAKGIFDILTFVNIYDLHEMPHVLSH